MHCNADYGFSNSKYLLTVSILKLGIYALQPVEGFTVTRELVPVSILKLGIYALQHSWKSTT